MYKAFPYEYSVFLFIQGPLLIKFEEDLTGGNKVRGLDQSLELIETGCFNYIIDYSPQWQMLPCLLTPITI